MALEQALLSWIHITSAAIWVGGSLFIGVVFAPILKKMSMSVEERLQLMIKVGRRFNKIAVPALVILIVTGMYRHTWSCKNPMCYLILVMETS